jgi:magnesium-transporting ATPase (P-type)
VLLWRVLLVSLVMAAIAFGLDAWAGHSGLPAEASRTLVVNAIVAMEVGYLFAARQARLSAFSAEGFRGTPAVWTGIAIVAAAQALLTWAPPLQEAFGTAALDARGIALCLGAGAVLLAVVEAEKALRRTAE